jgi:hypothetical protein
MRRTVMLIALVAFACQEDTDEAPPPDAGRTLADAAPPRIEDAAPPRMDVAPAVDVAPPDADLVDAAPDEPDAAPEPDAMPLPACGDGEDNDGDGRVDLLDPGCEARDDDDETDPPPCAGRPLIDLNAALAEGEFVMGTTEDAGGGYAGTCGGLAGGEVVFTYTVESTADALVFRTDYEETTAPTVMYVRSDCEALGDLGCNRGNNASPGTRLRFEPPEPGTYYIVIDTGSRDGGGAFKLGLEIDPLPLCGNGQDDDGDRKIDIADPGCEDELDDDETDPDPLPRCADGLDNDEDGLIDYPDDPDCPRASSDSETPLACMHDEVIILPTEGGEVQTNTGNAGNDYQADCGGRANEQVFALFLPAPADIVFEMVQGSYDTLIFVRRACDDPATEVDCDDDGGSGTLSRIDISNAEPGPYYFFVDGFSERTGTGTARITVTPR